MNEIEAIGWKLEKYGAILTQRIDRVYNALEELQRITILLMGQNHSDEKIDIWLQKDGFDVDENGFFQSLPLLDACRTQKAPADAISFSWEGKKCKDQIARQHLYCHRNIGAHLKHIHDRLGDVGWIYYQDSVSNTALQYPYIDQCTAITSDFDWSTYHTYLSVCPENNPQRRIGWTPPSIDYAGEGPILSVSIPVWHEDSFVGLWSIDLPIRYFYRDFASIKSLPDQVQFIVDKEGMLLLHDTLRTEISQEKGQIFLHPLTKLGGQWARLQLDSILVKENGVLSVEDDKRVEWIYCHSRVAGLEWILFCGMPMHSMEEAASQRLRQAFELISNGDFSHRIDTSPVSALPTLVDEFNKMTLRLSQADERRKDIESQLRQAQKMESIGNLAGGIAHDFNNILSSILGFSELALDEVEKGSIMEDNLQEIYAGGLRAKEIVKQILAFARQSDEDLKPTRVGTFIIEALKLIRPTTPTTIEIRKEINSSSLVMGNATQIHQIIMNLCSNAVHAMQDGGGIMEVVLKDVHFGEDTPPPRGLEKGEYIELAISDTGCGIKPEHIDSIFDPYFTTKGTGEGTGMGLAMVRGIVVSYGGSITVKSTPFRKTVFTIYLPITSNLDSEIVYQPETLPQGNEHILFVDDEPPIARMGSRILESLGYRVTTRTSSFEALELFKVKPGEFQLVITDMTMPHMTGDVFAIELKEIRADIPIILCTGYSNKINAETAQEIGINAFTYKPISKADLASTVREVLDKA